MAVAKAREASVVQLACGTGWRERRIRRRGGQSRGPDVGRRRVRAVRVVKGSQEGGSEY